MTTSTAAVPTVNLDPQDGDIAVFEEIEAVFAVELTQEDVGEWRTVGDIHETLLLRLADRRDGEACATAMTFYRIRQALGGRALGLTPHTPLAQLVGRNPKKWRSDLQRKLALDLPHFAWTTARKMGCVLGLSAAAGLLFGLLLDSTAIAAGSVIALLLSYGLGTIDCLSLPADLVMLGDLARAIAARNVGALALQGARLRNADIWQAICAIIAEETGTPRDQIGPDSYLFAHVLKADQKAA